MSREEQRQQQQAEAIARYKRDQQKQQIRDKAQPPAYKLGDRDPQTGSYIATAPNGGTRKATPLFNSGQSQGGTLKTSYDAGGRILLDAKNRRPQRRPLLLEEETPIIYPIKILFYNSTDRGVYIGGDRETPTLVFTLPEGSAIEHARIDSTGVEENDWIVSLQYITDNSDYYYPNKKVTKVFHGKSDLGTNWTLSSEEAMATRPVGHGRFISYTDYKREKTKVIIRAGQLPDGSTINLDLSYLAPNNAGLEVNYTTTNSGFGDIRYNDEWGFPSESSQITGSGRPRNNEPLIDVPDSSSSGSQFISTNALRNVQITSSVRTDYVYQWNGLAGGVSISYLYGVNISIPPFELYREAGTIGVADRWGDFGRTDKAVFTRPNIISSSYNLFPLNDAVYAVLGGDISLFINDADEYNFISGVALNSLGWRESEGKKALKWIGNTTRVDMDTPEFLTGVAEANTDASVVFSGNATSYIIKNGEIVNNQKTHSLSGTGNIYEKTSSYSGSGEVVIDEFTTKPCSLNITGNPKSPTIVGTNYGTVVIAKDGSSIFMKDDMAQSGGYPNRATYFYKKASNPDAEITDSTVKDKLKLITDSGKNFMTLLENNTLTILPKQDAPTFDWASNSSADVAIFDLNANSLQQIQADYLPVTGEVLSASYYP